MDTNWLLDMTIGRLVPSPGIVNARLQDLRLEMPGATDDQICDRLIAEAATQAAAIGAGLTAPAEIPGLGTVLSWLGVPVELVALWAVQAGLVLYIAQLYGHDPQPHARGLELLSVLGLVTTPTVLGEEGVKSLITVGGPRVLRQVAARVGFSGLERVGARALGILAIAADAGLNAASTMAVGRRARSHFSARSAAFAFAASSS